MIFFFYYFQYVTSHLKLLNFILEEGKMYLPFDRAKDIWRCLVKSGACDWDKEVCLYFIIRRLFRKPIFY